MNKFHLSAVATLAVALVGSASATSSTSDSCCSDACASGGEARCPEFLPCKITKAPFGKTRDGQNVDIFTLRNLNGVEARICNYGGIIVSLKAPDR